MLFKINILMLLLLGVIYTPLHSQNQLRISGEAKFLPGELIDNSIRDVNGEVAAGLRVITDLPGLAFEARNGVVKLNTKPGEYFLFLQPTERVVRILSTGFLPLEIYLYDIGVRLKSGQTWQIAVTGDKENEFIAVNFITQPEDVTIRVDGSPLNPPFSNVLLAVGKHQFSVSKDGFNPITEEIEVSNKNTLFKYNLKKVNLVGVTFNSQPRGASVFVEGTEIGQTPTSMFRFPGVYEVKIQQNGYITQTELVEIKEQKNPNESVQKTYTLVKNSGFIQLKRTPSDAIITINDVPVQDGLVEKAPGIYTLRAQKAGFLPFEETIELKLGETLSKTINLVSNTGKLTWNVEPKNAKVFINKEQHSGISQKELISGMYLVEIQLENHDSISETIEIKRGEELKKSWKLIEHTAQLRFLANPADATVALKKDGKIIQKWSGLKVLPQLAVGTYELEVKHPDYRPQTKKLTLKRYDEQEVKINLEPRPPLEKLERFGGIENVGKALLFPGWGVSSVTGGEKSGTWITISSLAMLGGAFFAEMQSQSLYSEYLKEPDLLKSNQSYDKANMFRQTSLGLATAGIGFWVYNLVSVALKGAANDTLKKQLREEEKFSWQLAPKEIGLSLTLKF